MLPQLPSPDDAHPTSSGNPKPPRTGDASATAFPPGQPGGGSLPWPADPEPAWVWEQDAHPYHRGRLPQATHAAERDFPCCGDPKRMLAADDPVAVVDAIRIELLISPEGVIQEARFEGTGCRLSQAAASRLVRRVERLTVEQAKRFSAAEMLRGLGDGVPLGRQRCALLGWRTFQKALDCPRAYDNPDARNGLIDRAGDQVPRHFGGPSLEEES